MKYTNGEFKSLIGGKIKSQKWYWKLLRKQCAIIVLIIVLIFVAIYILFSVMVSSNQPKSYETVKVRTRNPLRISSSATTTGDYLKRCAPRVKCDSNAKYRSMNGSCNNLETPTWGASETPFLRLFDANYDDGYHAVRKQTNGSPLPNVRELNIQFFMGREQYRVDANNVFLMPFGQMLAHDTTGIKPDTLISSEGVVTDCCLDENARRTMPQCLGTFDYPPDDPVYVKHGLRCQSKYRYQTSRNYSCPLTPTTYFNSKSHFIDVSEVYGETDSAARHIRLMEGGKLNFSKSENGQIFCPFQKIKSSQPEDIKSIKFQYDSGDPNNTNQNMGITALTTLFLRFHNYVAFRLSFLNPSWSDETLYQESRRIVIGTIQRATYKDFLPIIIGKDYQELYGLNAENIYDSTIDPSVSQEWSTAAYRVLHSIIPIQFNFVNNDYKIESSMVITDWMSDPKLLPIDDNFSKLIKGFLETAGRVSQPSYNFFVSNFMFHPPSEPAYLGFDLLSGDILAGRDIGLPPYNQVRHLCGLPLAKDFDDLVDQLHIKDISLLKKHYHSVDDIDLMVGILLEKLSDGAVVGPTARCLIADSFYRLKAGDRFFYDVQGQPGSFTPDQLDVIQKITLGHVICATTTVSPVQEDIFKVVNHNLFPTSKLICDDDFYIDLEPWGQKNVQTEL